MQETLWRAIGPDCTIQVMRLRLMAILAAAACGGRPDPAPISVPASIQELSATDARLSPIALAAATALRPTGAGKVYIVGVEVGGRRLNALADTVASSIGAERLREGDGQRVPFVVARMDGFPVRSSAAGARLDEDLTVKLTVFRAGSDVAYVGAEARAPSRQAQALCITLLRSDSTWKVSDRRDVATPQTCGRK
jgi:hypothetical protein